MPGNDLDGRLPAALAAAEDLPSVPAVAISVLRLTRDERARMEDIAQVLAMDPALSAKLLKLANSSLFNVGFKVTTLQRACMVLGLKTVKLMSLSFSLVTSLQDDDGLSLDYGDFWKRSIVRAAAARSLARLSGEKLDDEAFLCGLLSRLGQLVLARCMTREYEPVLARSGGAWPDPSDERAVLGFDSPSVAGALLASWGLPTLLCDAVTFFERPERMPPRATSGSQEICRLVHVAARCEELVCNPGKGKARGVLNWSAAAWLSLPEEAVDSLLATLEADVEEIGSVLDARVGALDVARILQQAQGELARMSLGVASDARRVEQEASQLQDRKRELEHAAHTDSLTGLANRAEFQRVLQECVEERLTGAHEDELGLLLLDIDHFKSVNDQYGHPAGDDVLRALGKLLRDATRGDDVACRYGGEEFVVIMPQTTWEGLESVAERIRTAVEAQPIETRDITLPITVSLGGSSLASVSDPDCATSLVDLADRCLYEAKQSGRNRSVLRRFGQRTD